MEENIKKLTQKLINLQDNTKDIDGVLKDMRVKINDMIWDLIESRNKKDRKSNEAP